MSTTITPEEEAGWVEFLQAEDIRWLESKEGGNDGFLPIEFNRYKESQYLLML